MASSFRYQARSDDDWEKRASQQGGSFQGYILDDFRLYSLKKGENAIRILPPTWDRARHYGIDIFTHFSVGPDKATVLCPLKMETGNCPICEARALAEKRGDEDLVKELRPSKRVLIWLVDRKDEEKGPVIWGMPWTVDAAITKVSRDRMTGKFYTIDHPEEGFDVYFDREGEGIGTKYTGVTLARRATSVDPDWLDYIQQHPLPTTLLERDYDEIKTLFEGGKPAASAPKDDPRPIERAARTNGSERPAPVSDHPAPGERPARPVFNRRHPDEEGPPFDTAADPPSEEPPPPEEEDTDRPRPRPKTPAEREPVPASATASKAADLRARFSARKT